MVRNYAESTRPPNAPIDGPTSMALYSYITSQTNQSDVFLAGQPRAIALFGARKATVYFEPRNDAALWRFIRGWNIDYLIYSRSTDPAWIRDFVARYPSELQQTFENSDFAVYRLASWPAATQESS